MVRIPNPMSRRRFLGTLGGGLAAVVMAACGIERSASPTPSASAQPASPSPTPEPTPTATPAPSLRDRIGQMLLVGFSFGWGGSYTLALLLDETWQWLASPG